MTDPTGRTPLISTTTQQFAMAIVILLLAAGVLLILAFVKVPSDNQTLFTALVGGIAGWVGATISFYFPSSVGARSKDEAIATLSAAVATPPGSTTTTHTTTSTEPLATAPLNGKVDAPVEVTVKSSEAEPVVVKEAAGPLA